PATVWCVRRCATRDHALGFHGARIGRITIVDLHHELHRPRLPWAMSFAHLNNRSADSDFRVLNNSVRRSIDRDLFGVESAFQKLDHLWRADRMKVSHQVRHTFRNVVWPG